MFFSDILNGVVCGVKWSDEGTAWLHDGRLDKLYLKTEGYVESV